MEVRRKVGNTTQTRHVTEASFIKSIAKKTKNFLKNTAKDIKRNAKKIFNAMKKEFLGSKSVSQFKPGALIAMNYKAKDATKKYDKNPLIICLGWSQNKKLSKTHFFGLNIHWASPGDRVALATFFTELLEKRGGRLTYQDVKPFMDKFKGKPILRMYIYKNVGPKVMDMPPDQYQTAAAIPSEQWVGG